MKFPRIYPSKEWRSSVWDKASIPVVVIVIFGAVGYSAYEQHSSAVSSSIAAYYGQANHTLLHVLQVSGENHHKSTVSKDNEILTGEKIIEQGAQLLLAYHSQTVSQIAVIQNLENEIQTLEEQVANVIEGLPGASKELTEVAEELEGQIEALCAAGHVNCPPITIPKS